ncbi:tetraspanin-8-like isoform X2 [Thalassophryne amazonica]|uniref:tetraspanin-8-like isoform X2 n=1 Tax=Thalassophryne amazonica TaxID=390379 RepID=UPI0014710928|nr:tetraspanin-8-like isoform X2 [Thalassophryne amazonica]
MGQINTCLKWIFTIFNIFFAIVGGVIIALALLSQIITNVHGGELEGRTSGLIILYVVGAITMVIAIVGAYGAHKENRVALIVFLVCMVIGSLMMLRIGIPAAMARSELEDLLEERLRRVLPLNTADQDVRNVADKLQETLHCCGLFSYTDWGQDIPNSCLCNQQAESLHECRLVNYNVLMQKLVYKKTCFPIIMHYVLLVADIMLGVVFTLAALALLGMALSSLMIYQMRFPSSAPMVLTVPAVFSPQPPKYQELHNPPEYGR